MVLNASENKSALMVRILTYYTRDVRPEQDWWCILWYPKAKGVKENMQMSVVTAVYSITELITFC